MDERSSLIETFESIVEKVAPGMAPSYTQAHVLMALETIQSFKSIGRLKLSRILKIGEGAMRTMIRRLLQKGLVKVSREGVSLSSEGERFMSELRKIVTPQLKMPSSGLTVGEYNVAIMVKDSSSAVRRGLEQRDAAIRVGASGATTLIFKMGKLIIPGMEEEEVYFNQTYRFLMEKMKPDEGDVIIIGSAENEHLASLGAKMAVMELLKSVK